MDRYPNLPDPLLLKNGRIVTSSKIWWKHRRPEIAEDFNHIVSGCVPKITPLRVMMEFGFGAFPGGAPPSAPPSCPTWQQQVLAKGWGYAVLVPTAFRLIAVRG